MQNIIVISGSSGSGKSTLARELTSRWPEQFGIAKSVTTRMARNKNEYYTFVSEKEFFELEKDGAFVETNCYEGNNEYYGTPSSEVERIINSGRHAILDIDVNGRKQIAEGNSKYQLLSVFVLVPAKRIYERLIDRGETPESAYKRMIASTEEMEKGKAYDAFIVNETLEEALNDLYNTITGNRNVKEVDIRRYIEDTRNFLQHNRMGEGNNA